MALGLIPGVITALIFGGGVVAVVVWVDDWARGLVTALTGDPTPNRVLVALAMIALAGGATLLVVYTFTAVTLLIGQPFFEHISDKVGDTIGLPPWAWEEPWWRAVLRGIRESVVLIAVGAAVGVGLFFLGLVPIVGAVLAFTIGALVGGRFMALELTSYPLSRLGVVTLAQRKAALAARRPLTWGFGVTAYLLCLVPLAAVVCMPALIAGATRLVGEIRVQSAEISATS
jgi:CysZ protein